MLSGAKRYCDICYQQHMTSIAVEWCPVCEENLCVICKTHHSLAKLTKTHELVAVEKVSKLPQFVVDIKINCPYHHERLVYFCTDHDAPCCVQCLKLVHSSCHTLTALENIVQGIKSSTSFFDLEILVTDLLTNIENMTKDRTEYRMSLYTMVSKCVQDLKATRAAINDHLDKMERTLMTNIEEIFTTKDTEIESILLELDNHKANATKIQENLDLLKLYASDFQTFLAMRDIIKSVGKEEKEIQSLLNGDTLKWNSLSVQMVELKVILKKLSTLGKVEVQSNPKKLKYIVRKVKEAQILKNMSVSKNKRLSWSKGLPHFDFS